jgi:signal transduction histidine kinase
MDTGQSPEGGQPPGGRGGPLGAPWPGHRRLAGGPPWPGHRRLPGGPPIGLAVLIALVQAAGTTLAGRGQPEQLDPLGYALLVGGGLALAARRRWPVPTYAATAAAALAYQLLDYPGGPSYVAAIIAGIGAVKAGQRYPAWAVTAAAYAGWLALAAPSLRQAVVLAGWVLGMLVVAEWARAAVQHRARAAQVQQERARARDEQQRRQASEERLRIARELHDVLGHHLSLINVQAGVGLHLIDSQPAQARAALGAIKQASAEALREVRSVLATLHPAGESVPLAPAPGLDRLAELTTGAGLPVRTSVRGQPRPLPAGVDRTAYRIVREALTNVRRHAGAGATATVMLEYRREELVVQVDDDGVGAAATAVAGGGGISGMRERTAALGGSLSAGPGPAGGYSVRARLPLPAPPAGSPESAGPADQA